MIAPPERRVQLIRMEAARRETRQHLDLIHRQIAGRAGRLTVTEKAKARNRTHKRSGSRWSRSDEMLFQGYLERLTFERHHEIEALSRKLVRQDRAIAALRQRSGLASVPYGRRREAAREAAG